MPGSHIGSGGWFKPENIQDHSIHSVPITLMLSTEFELQPMEIIAVISSPLARCNTFIEQLVASFLSLYDLDKVSDAFILAW